MGCHTWFYRKVIRSREEAKELALKKCDECIKNYLTFSDFPKGDISRGVKAFERYKQFISKDLFKTGFWELQPEWHSQYIKDHGFFVALDKEEENLHDVFRVGGSLYYTEEMLFSKEESINFIENNIGEIFHQYPSTKLLLQELNKFWDKHPDGLIQFG